MAAIASEKIIELCKLWLNEKEDVCSKEAGCHSVLGEYLYEMQRDKFDQYLEKFIYLLGKEGVIEEHQIDDNNTEWHMAECARDYYNLLRYVH